MARATPVGRAAARPAYEQFAPEIRGDFVGACHTLYWLRPKSQFDPETGEEVEGVAETGLVRAILWPEQARTARIMLAQQRQKSPVRVVKVKCRQSGDSSYSAMWQFHHVYWGRQQRGLTVAHHDTTTNSLWNMMLTLYAELPSELQLPTKKENRKELAWESGSSLIAQTAGYVELGHGLTLQHALLSEIDRWADQDRALEGILEAIPEAPGTSITIESKAERAGGWLHTFWRNSKRGLTGFTPIFTPWFLVPTFRLPVAADFEPTEEEVEWIAEFSLAPAQVLWYRKRKAAFIAKEPWGGERRFHSSYPFTDEQSFQSSGYCIFPDAVLARLHEGCRPPRAALRLEHMPEPGQIREVPEPIDPARPQLWIWSPPEEGRFFSLGVDISDGVGQTESVVSVCAYPGYEQVAEWASTRSSVEETAYVVRYLAEKYGGHNTMIIPEINRNGSLILYILFQLPGSYTIFRWRYLSRPGVATGDQSLQGWQCVDPDARVLTADLRWVPAHEIQVGDTLYGCQEKSRGGKGTQPQLGVQVVVERKVFEAPLVEVRLANGYATRVSLTHPFWAYRKGFGRAKWTEARALRPGDGLRCLPLWETLRSYEAGRLSAFLDGEGHLSQGRKYGMQLLITQAEGPLADEIAGLWKSLGFQHTFKWLRHKGRHHKNVGGTGMTRLAQVLRALGSLRPTRLLRKFATDFAHERLTLRGFELVRVVEVKFVGYGPVIGLETSPDHTLIADGIVGHNTNDVTKKLLAQVNNMVYLRGQGAIRSEILYDEMKVCVDIGPRWQASGKSDRVIAWMIAVIGAYLDFEGGSVGNIMSDQPRELRIEGPGRDPATYDADFEDLFRPPAASMSMFEREDREDR